MKVLPRQAIVNRTPLVFGVGSERRRWVRLHTSLRITVTGRVSPRAHTQKHTPSAQSDGSRQARVCQRELSGPIVAASHNASLHCLCVCVYMCRCAACCGIWLVCGSFFFSARQITFKSLSLTLLSFYVILPVIFDPELPSTHSYSSLNSLTHSAMLSLQFLLFHTKI